MSTLIRLLTGRRRGPREVGPAPARKKNNLACTVILLDGTDYTVEINVSNFVFFFFLFISFLYVNYLFVNRKKKKKKKRQCILRYWRHYSKLNIQVFVF